VIALKFALRELRSGVRGFGVFLACLALGVAAIAGVASISRSLSDSIAREGSVILGGDVALTLSAREANETELNYLEERGRVAVVATMRAMARVGEDNATLVELKAVDSSYPLTGEIKLDPDTGLLTALASPEGAYGAVADPALLARLDVNVGDRIKIADADFEITGTIASEPDKLGQGLGFGPRLIITNGALRRSGLLQPGSLVRWSYRIKLHDGTARGLREFVDETRSRFPDSGWDIRTRDKASPQLERNVRRFTEFLTLVGLTALLVGGVGRECRQILSRPQEPHDRDAESPWRDRRHDLRDLFCRSGIACARRECVRADRGRVYSLRACLGARRHSAASLHSDAANTRALACFYLWRGHHHRIRRLADRACA